MILIKSSADMTRALASPLDADIIALLVQRRDHLQEEYGCDLGELAHFVIVEPGDSIATIEESVGLALVTNVVDGRRYGDSGFTDNFEFVEFHPGGWIEAVQILSDDGFGIVLFVPNRPDIDATLLGLMRDHA